MEDSSSQGLFHVRSVKKLQPGGLSSKQIPPSSMHPLPSAWEQVGVDIAEWTVPTQDLKVKFILFIDLATKFRVTETLFTYKHGETQTETADQVIRALMLRWLVEKPRPRYVVFDNANTMTSVKTVEILADVGHSPFLSTRRRILGSWNHRAGSWTNQGDSISSTTISAGSRPCADFGDGNLCPQQQPSSPKALPACNGPMAIRTKLEMMIYDNNFHFQLTDNNKSSCDC